MYQGKYSNNKPETRRRRRRSNRKPSLLLIALILALVVAVGSTIGYLFTKTGEIENSFKPVTGDIEITEKFDGTVKNDVAVKNKSNFPVFIRATVVVTWQNDDGHIYHTAPVQGVDYTAYYPGNGWVMHTDGYYYYTEVVAENASTRILLTSCEPIQNQAPEGYHLVVEILAEAIQSEPITAVTDAWGVNPTTLGGSEG